MIPNRVTSKGLRDGVKRLADHLGVEIIMRNNSYRRWALFAFYGEGPSFEYGDMITPGYMSNRELACWMSGVWLRYDKRSLFDNETNS